MTTFIYGVKKFRNSCQQAIDENLNFEVKFTEERHRSVLLKLGEFFFEGEHQGSFFAAIKVFVIMLPFATIHFNALGHGYRCELKNIDGKLIVQYFAS